MANVRPRHIAWRLALTLVVLLSGCVGLSEPFRDDFSNSDSGWRAATRETYVRGYLQGWYVFQIDVPRWFVWATAGRRYRDVALEVTARSEGSTDNHFGLVCRYQEGDFYYFAVSADGYYAIYRRDAAGESLIPLTGRAMLRTPTLRTGGTENRIRAVCEGEQLTLYVNGEQVVQVEDATLTVGDVGMAAGTLRESRTSVWFDDFEATVPERR